MFVAVKVETELLILLLYRQVQFAAYSSQVERGY